MKLIDLKKIMYMDYLIQKRRTGGPREFAQKVQLSRSALFQYITYMREELEIGILYDRFSATYYYENADLYSALRAQIGINN